VIEHARSVLQLLEMMVKSEFGKGLHGGSVRACFRSMYVLPPVIARFRFPAIAVNIIEHFDYAGVEHALREGRADIGFTYIHSNE